MGMAAILVMWPRPFYQTFVPPSHGGSTYNLASIGQAVSKEKEFENVVKQNLCCSMNQAHGKGARYWHDRELNAHFYSTASLKSCPRHLTWYHTQLHYPDTGSTIFNDFGMSRLGTEPMTARSPKGTLYLLSYRGRSGEEDCLRFLLYMGMWPSWSWDLPIL